MKRRENHNVSAQGWTLRLESLAIVAVTLAAYARYDFSWLLLIGLFLAPDLAALGYLLGNHIGAVIYNIAHTYTTPLIFGALALFVGWTFGFQLALIWILHIAVDRLVGYGLKYGSGFKETHLSRV